MDREVEGEKEGGRRRGRCCGRGEQEGKGHIETTGNAEGEIKGDEGRGGGAEEGREQRRRNTSMHSGSRPRSAAQTGKSRREASMAATKMSGNAQCVFKDQKCAVLWRWLRRGVGWGGGGGGGGGKRSMSSLSPNLCQRLVLHTVPFCSQKCVPFCSQFILNLSFIFT